MIGSTNCGPSIMDATQQQDGMNPSNTQLHGRISKALCYSRVQTQKLHTLWSIQFTWNFTKDRKRIFAYQVPGMVGGTWLQRGMRLLFGDGSILYLDWGGGYRIVSFCQISSLKLMYFILVLFVSFCSVTNYCTLRSLKNRTNLLSSVLEVQSPKWTSLH